MKKIPTIKQQGEKYKEILELLGFNFENKEKEKYVSLGSNLSALMKIGIEISSKKWRDY